MNKRIDISLGVTLAAVGVVGYNLIDYITQTNWIEVWDWIAPSSRWILLGLAIAWLMIRFAIWEDELMREHYTSSRDKLAKIFEGMFKDEKK